MSKKQHQPKNVFRDFNRMEITIAEIMRVNYPLYSTTQEDETYDLWVAIVEDLSNMFGTKDPRFDEEGFYERCYGEDWGRIKSESTEPPSLAELIDRAEAQALDAEIGDMQTTP